jgi:hypothetical protein
MDRISRGCRHPAAVVLGGLYAYFFSRSEEMSLGVPPESRLGNDAGGGGFSYQP